MENIIAVKCPKCGGDMELPVDALAASRTKLGFQN